MNLDTIRAEMSAYRLGLAPLPKSYVDLHQKLAWDDLARFLVAQGRVVVTTRIVPDGWCDGMEVLEVVAANEEGVVRFVWSDANGGSWFRRCASGGSALVEVAPNAVGHL